MALWINVFLESIVLIFLVLLEVAAGKSTISPSYVWPLRYIYNKTVPVFPPLSVHGNLIDEATLLKFDGKTSWLDAGELSGSCISQPQTCSTGLSVAIRLIVEKAQNSPSAKFYFDSGGYNGEGVSIYQQNGQLVGQVADKKRVWKVTSEISPNTWHFILLTWSYLHGLFIFVDGPLKGQSSQPVSFQSQPVATSNHVIIGKCNAANENTFAAFSSDLVAVFDIVTPDGKVYLSYSFSAPTTRGNIRYVNAKFINSADFDLIIFPDRGEHQSTGYQLESRSSTLLEYVLREGPLPVGMNFRLQNKKNGEQLTFKGKDNLHVVSSDDKQVVNGYRIQPDGSIKLASSTSAVSINYEIKPAQINSEKEVHAPGTVSPKPIDKPTEKPSNENLLTDNPENPDQEETNNTAPATTTPSQKANKNETEATATTKYPKPPPQQTSTIAPTVPPPPELPVYSKPTPTLKQIVVNNGNVTEFGSNATSPNTNGTEPVTGPVSNTTLNRPEVNEKSGNKSKEVTISSPEMPDEDEQFNGIQVGNNTALNLTGGDLELPNENVTEPGMLTTNVTSGNYTAVNETSGNTTASNLTSTEQNKTEEGKAGVGEGARPSLISTTKAPNPWIDVAKNVQQQQLKPIPWENGQGAYNAIHNMANTQGNQMAAINYNVDNNNKGSHLNNKPVWQYVNGRPVTGEWFGESQHLTERQTPGTSPFKFANAKTQEQIESYYKPEPVGNYPAITNANGPNNKISYVKPDRQKDKQVL